ncbi:hypothetical protein ACWDO0_17310 [Nocardia rhamnosiphila]
MTDYVDSRPVSEILSESAVKFVEKFGMECLTLYRGKMAFRRKDPSTGTRLLGIEFEHLELFEEQISLNSVPLEERFGHVNQNGLYEVELDFGGFGRQWLNGKTSIETNTPPCRHYPILSNPPSADSDTILDEENEDADGQAPKSAIIHVNDPKTGVCLEISAATPMGILFSRGRMVIPRSSRDVTTLKVFADTMDCEALTLLGSSLTDSFLYELAIRNNLTARPVHRRLGPPVRIRDSGSGTPIRFPRTTLAPEVAQMFNSALTNPSNYLSAFLSYYQVLEFYFPYAIRRQTIRKVRNELTDPSFESRDLEILRIIGIAEGGARSSEATQIATLLEEWARGDKLIEFFSQPDFSEHFSQSGPISGIDPINLKNKGIPLSAQVASRVYGLRNRVVHAKDDPKYSETKVLLPSSREAQFMAPDVELVKLLSQEVITYAQMQA